MKNNSLKTLIITCWIVLEICLIIKLLGGNLFELASNNEKFISFCNFADNTMWFKMLLACIVYSGSTYGVLCIELNKTHLSFKESLIFVPLMITKSILFWCVPIIATILDFAIAVFIPLFIQKFKNWKRVLITFVLLQFFQIMSLIVRDIGFSNFNDNSTLLSIIMQCDYYIMIVLTYLYNIQLNKRKEMA